jgi:outer membrane protein assembly factor BamE (lipoprotein component of BamABCDE complex)
MRRLAAGLAVLALMAAVGCSAPSQSAAPARASIRSPLVRVKMGMSASQVLALAGEPALRRSEDGAELWYYESGVVMLRAGRVAFSYPSS